MTGITLTGETPAFASGDSPSIRYIQGGSCAFLTGDVIEPEQGLIAIGSGGPFAQASARALLENTDLSAHEIVEKGLDIAADICIYTNHNRTLEVLSKND